MVGLSSRVSLRTRVALHSICFCGLHICMVCSVSIVWYLALSVRTGRWLVELMDGLFLRSRVTISNPITEQACVIFDTNLFFFLISEYRTIYYKHCTFILVCKLSSSLFG